MRCTLGPLLSHYLGFWYLCDVIEATNQLDGILFTEPGEREVLITEPDEGESDCEGASW